MLTAPIAYNNPSKKELFFFFLVFLCATSSEFTAHTILSWEAEKTHL